jgi:hypothetical protein
MVTFTINIPPMLAYISYMDIHGSYGYIPPDFGKYPNAKQQSRRSQIAPPFSEAVLRLKKRKDWGPSLIVGKIWKPGHCTSMDWFVGENLNRKAP